MARQKRDVYMAIMRAAARGEGVRLSSGECFDLSLDDAISTRAHNGLDELDWSGAGGEYFDWSSFNPRRKGRSPKNLTMDARTRREIQERYEALDAAVSGTKMAQAARPRKTTR